MTTLTKAYKFEKWVCDRCGAEGQADGSEQAHIGHPAGWRPGGNTPRDQQVGPGSSRRWGGFPSKPPHDSFSSRILMRVWFSGGIPPNLHG
jgi:hypothetical protein